MADAVALFAIAVLIVGANCFHLGRRTLEVVGLSRRAVSMLQNRALSDIEKERAARAASVELLAHFSVLTVATLGVIVLSCAFVSPIILLRWVSVQQIIGAFMSPFVGIGGIVLFSLDIARRRWLT